MTQVVDLNAAIAIHEAERTVADAARDEAEQGRRHLKAEC